MARVPAPGFTASSCWRCWWKRSSATPSPFPPGDTTWRRRRRPSAWREFGFLLTEVNSLIYSGYGGIQRHSSEPRRTSRVPTGGRRSKPSSPSGANSRRDCQWALPSGAGRRSAFQAVPALLLRQRFAVPPAFGELCRPEAGVPSRPRAFSPSAICRAGLKAGSPFLSSWWGRSGTCRTRPRCWRSSRSTGSAGGSCRGTRRAAGPPPCRCRGT